MEVEVDEDVYEIVTERMIGTKLSFSDVIRNAFSGEKNLEKAFRRYMREKV